MVTTIQDIALGPLVDNVVVSKHILGYVTRITTINAAHLLLQKVPPPYVIVAADALAANEYHQAVN